MNRARVVGSLPVGAGVAVAVQRRGGRAGMPRRRKRARVEVVELPDHDGSDEADDRASSSSDDEQELVIDDALLAQDAPFELRCWSEAIAGATAQQLHELCAEAFMAFQGRSFWVPADRSPPTVGDGGWAVLERFAADVYVRDFVAGLSFGS